VRKAGQRSTSEKHRRSGGERRKKIQKPRDWNTRGERKQRIGEEGRGKKNKAQKGPGRITGT